MNSATAASLRMIIAGYFRVKPNRVVDDARFRDLGADWLDRLELLLMIEDQLPELQTDKLIVGQIETVGDLVRALGDLSTRAKRSVPVNTKFRHPPANFLLHHTQGRGTLSNRASLLLWARFPPPLPSRVRTAYMSSEFPFRFFAPCNRAFVRKLSADYLVPGRRKCLRE